MNPRARVTSALVAAMVLLAAGVWLRYPGGAPSPAPATACDPELWNHVYERERLHVIEECTAIIGRVVELHRNSDGDLHISLDPDQQSVLNLVNVFHADRTLVVEVVCNHPPSRDDAKPACANFQAHVTLPNPGEHIRVTGAYVTDMDNGWREIHPVSRIEVLR